MSTGKDNEVPELWTMLYTDTSPPSPQRSQHAPVVVNVSDSDQPPAALFIRDRSFQSQEADHLRSLTLKGGKVGVTVPEDLWLHEGINSPEGKTQMKQQGHDSNQSNLPIKY
ncbi:unnamed protein product [Pleuronectes platessa]|uniref:Uncharacterized protein n=1 Tax=Pleuronectes platessa TaxID=8262 RepID=A0A9N7TXC7_PLEPL|nr:unnamed protein product [Pleuronectes platessa]